MQTKVVRGNLPAIFGTDQVVIRTVSLPHDDRQAMRHGLLHRQSAGAGQDEQVAAGKICCQVPLRVWRRGIQRTGKSSLPALPARFAPDRLLR